jgi:hypothetical protein
VDHIISRGNLEEKKEYGHESTSHARLDDMDGLLQIEKE